MDRVTGEKQSRTEWFRVNCTVPHTQEFIKNYIRKGSKVYVEGPIKLAKWTDKTGKEQSQMEINMKPGRGEIQILSNKEDQSMEL